MAVHPSAKTNTSMSPYVHKTMVRISESSEDIQSLTANTYVNEIHTHPSHPAHVHPSLTQSDGSHHTEVSVTRERGIRQQALSIQSGPPPLGPCSHTYKTQLHWINECSRVKDRATHTNVHTHNNIERDERGVSEGESWREGGDLYHLT